jgi:NitT/TauT family transport system ATP-binding protein
MPLLDAAPIVVAAQRGFAKEEGLDLRLERETSWATLRDRIAVGHLDVAHMLAPMPIAANLGLTPLSTRLVVPMALGYGGNTLTASNALWQELGADAVALTRPRDAMSAGQALAQVIRRRVASGAPRLVIAVVHTHSAHYYQLAYWLAAVGIVPTRDIDLVVVPPSLSTAALAQGQIDAFCAGEPWGSVAVGQSIGHVLATNTSIWRSSPEKVLGVRARWAEDDVQRTLALVRCIHRAATWCDDIENAAELVRLLSHADAIGQDEGRLAAGLAQRRAPGDPAEATGFLTFARHGASFPWLSHASWFYSQMVRWGHASFDTAGLAAARATYRPDLFRAALAPLAVDLPAANSKVEGQLRAATPVGSSGGRLLLGPDTFCDDRVFDPDDVPGYLAGFPRIS